jgi:hypothetical protein
LRNNPKPAGEVLENVGYGSISTNPARILESPGYKMALEDALYAAGLDYNLVANALSEDIREKKGNRAAELRMAIEVLGMKAPTDDLPTKNVTNIINVKDIRDRYKPRD